MRHVEYRHRKDKENDKKNGSKENQRNKEQENKQGKIKKIKEQLQQDYKECYKKTNYLAKGGLMSHSKIEKHISS